MKNLSPKINVRHPENPHFFLRRIKKNKIKRKPNGNTKNHWTEEGKQGLGEKERDCVDINGGGEEREKNKQRGEREAFRRSGAEAHDRGSAHRNVQGVRSRRRGQHHQGQGHAGLTWSVFSFLSFTFWILLSPSLFLVFSLVPNVWFAWFVWFPLRFVVLEYR